MSGAQTKELLYAILDDRVGGDPKRLMWYEGVYEEQLDALTMNVKASCQIYNAPYTEGLFNLAHADNNSVGRMDLRVEIYR